MLCSNCDCIRINGLKCHETGCPTAYLDEVRECKECGADYQPDSRNDIACSPCCAAAYRGTLCDCMDCLEFYQDQYDNEEFEPDRLTVRDAYPAY